MVYGVPVLKLFRVRIQKIAIIGYMQTLNTPTRPYIYIVYRLMRILRLFL